VPLQGWLPRLLDRSLSDKLADIGRHGPGLLDPGAAMSFCGVTRVAEPVGAGHDGRVSGQPYRQALARELDDGVLATQIIFASRW
jgi:hypothetical protein